MADGGLIGDTVSGNEDERVVGLEDLGNGLTLSNWKVDQRMTCQPGGSAQGMGRQILVRRQQAYT